MSATAFQKLRRDKEQLETEIEVLTAEAEALRVEIEALKAEKAELENGSEINYAKMKVDELRTLAKEKGLGTGPVSLDDLKKEELIELLKTKGAE